MSDKITLDRETFKALAADTRVDMLKMLGEHKLTLTDMAERMKMSPSTIKEHLDKLVEVGLIEQEDKGMKWKYYRLTEKGRNIVSPYETKVWILLGTSILVLAGSALSLAGKLTETFSHSASNAVPAAAPRAAEMMLDKAAENVAQASTTLALNPTTSTLAARAVEDGGRLLSTGAGAANETLMAVANAGLTSPGPENMAYAAKTAVQEAVTTSTVFVQRTATTLAAQTTSTLTTHTSTTAERITTTTAAIVSEASSAAAAQSPYLEFILIGLSLIVAGVCVGYLLKRRLNR